MDIKIRMSFEESFTITCLLAKKGNDVCKFTPKLSSF